jgi:hypothetical protein
MVADMILTSEQHHVVVHPEVAVLVQQHDAHNVGPGPSHRHEAANEAAVAEKRIAFPGRTNHLLQGSKGMLMNIPLVLLQCNSNKNASPSWACRRPPAGQQVRCQGFVYELFIVDLKKTACKRVAFPGRANDLLQGSRASANNLDVAAEYQC